MKYSDILGLYEHFQPVYDITNEVEGDWKRFIPNERFYDVLQTTLTALDSGQARDRKPIWMQGAYGTGKTHAMAVIKHLFCDNFEDIKEYVESLDNSQIRERLRHFRQAKRIFPIILKGVSNIINTRTFALVIERAVEAALHQYNIQIVTRSDFEKIIAQIENPPRFMEWEKLIEEHVELFSYVSGKHDLLSKLQQGDIEIFSTLERILGEHGWHLSFSAIAEWLVQVSEELQKQGIADALMLFWDEFTNFLELGAAKELLTELQHVAELSLSHNVFLFVISHRRTSRSTLIEEDVKKILDRFHYTSYHMKPVTTYHIVSTAIKKKDQETWETLKNQYLENNRRFEILIQRLLKGDESASAMKAIKNLFPFHPYTAYLATFIARYLGSTERSIFNFLYDSDKGFLQFITEHPQTGDYYLTADYLWDYFIKDFENTENFSFGAILEKYKLHAPDVTQRGAQYAAIFKGILLLNVLTQVTGTEEVGKELVSPAIDNIESMFLGTQYEETIPEVLNVIDSTYIQKTPDNLFLVSTTALPLKEIEEQKRQLEKTYSEVTNILNHEQKQELLGTFKNGVLREIEVNLYWAGIQEHILRSRLNNTFKTTYSLHTALFLMREEGEKPHIRNIIEKLSEEFEHVIFVILDEALEKVRFSKFIEYKARAGVAEKHLYDEEKTTNENYAKQIIDNWVASLKNGLIELRCQGRNKKNIVSVFPAIVNKELSPTIFPYGLEIIRELQENQNIWKFQKSEKAIEAFLFPDSRTTLEENTKNFPYKNLRGIVKDRHGDYIIHESLEIKSDASDEHPVKRISKEVEQTIKKSEQFHLGDLLRFLSAPPYGLYTNSVNMAAISFVMGRYVGKLYEAGSGRLVNKQMMRDKIHSLFKYWQERKDGEKLHLRYGTVEEKLLIEKLISLFRLGDLDGLNNVRWSIREWIKKTNYPFWVFKQDAKGILKKAVDEIVWLTTSIDKEITQQDIERILDIITVNDVDLRLLLQKNPTQMFTAWLMHIDIIDFWEESTVDEIYTYLL